MPAGHRIVSRLSYEITNNNLHMVTSQISRVLEFYGVHNISHQGIFCYQLKVVRQFKKLYFKHNKKHWADYL